LNLNFYNLFKYKFDAENILLNENNNKIINLPITSKNIKLNYFKFKNKYNFINSEILFEEQEAGIINYFKILSTCLTELNLSENTNIDINILKLNTLDINFNILLDLKSFTCGFDNSQFDSNELLHYNLYYIYLAICKAESDLVTIDTILLDNSTKITYLLSKESLIMALTEFLIINTEQKFSTFDDITEFFNNFSNRFNFEKTSTIEVNNNIRLSVLDLVYFCDILGHKLAIIYNLIEAFKNTYCKTQLSVKKEKELIEFYRLLTVNQCAHTFGVKPFTFDIYHIDKDLRFTEYGDNIENYTKITITHDMICKNYLKNACLDNTKLYLFKIDFSTDQNSWSTLNPFIINNMDINKYDIISRNDIFSCKERKSIDNIELYDDTMIDNILDEEENE
jgi:hypothetical protein